MLAGVVAAMVMAFPDAPTLYSYREIHMGVAVELKFVAPTEAKAEEVARAVFARFAELEAIFSDYRADSEASRLAGHPVGTAVQVSPEMFTVLTAAQEVWKASDRAFDVTAGPVVRLWRQTRTTGRTPPYSELSAALDQTGFQHVRLDAKRRTVTVLKDGVRLDFGGITKGYACDEAIRVFDRHGIASASVVAGGDMKVSGPPPGRRGWPVDVTGRDEPVELVHQAASGSGDTEQSVTVWGVRYSHIVDPRNGFGVSSRIQATVIGKEGLYTDPWATVLCINGEKDLPKVERRGMRAWLTVATD